MVPWDVLDCARFERPRRQGLLQELAVSKTVSEMFVSHHRAPTAAIQSSVQFTELMGRLNVEPPNGVSLGLYVRTDDERMKIFVHNAMPAAGNGVDFQIVSAALAEALKTMYFCECVVMQWPFYRGRWLLRTHLWLRWTPQCTLHS